MKIEGLNSPALKAEVADLVKSLEAGDVVKGRVLEELDGMVTIKTSTGQQLTASLMTDTEITRGSFIELVITGMENGKVLAQLKEQEPMALKLESKLSELLGKLNIPVNDKSLETAKLLIKHNLPLDKQGLSTVISLEKNAASLAKTSMDGALGIILTGGSLEEAPLDALNKVALSTEQAVSSKLEEVIKQEPAPLAAAVKEMAGEGQRSPKTELTSSPMEATKDKAVNAGVEMRSVQGLVKERDEAADQDLEAKLQHLMKQLGIDEDKSPEVKNLIGALVKTVQVAGKATTESIVFLLSKDMEPNAKNLDLLEKHLNNQGKLSELLNKLEEQVVMRTPKELKELKEVKDEIRKVFLQPKQLESKEEIQEKLKDALRLGEKLEALLGQKEIKDIEIRSTLTSLRDNITFIKSINEHNNYLQIPLTINGANTSAEVYVFKDGKKSKAIDPGNATILLSLDLKYLGHLESMITVLQKSVNVTFRLEDERAGDLLKRSSERLRASLEARGYELNPIRVIKLEQAFNLITLQEFVNQGNKDRVHLDIKI